MGTWLWSAEIQKETTEAKFTWFSFFSSPFPQGLSLQHASKCSALPAADLTLLPNSRAQNLPHGPRKLHSASGLQQVNRRLVHQARAGLSESVPPSPTATATQNPTSTLLSLQGWEVLCVVSLFSVFWGPITQLPLILSYKCPA